ncbi:NAD-dependent malic enzyme [Acetobacteraceae bacterium]|nr:NAD-dependent malic enzyme [Acetobacteraceae bacterium]
MRFKMTQSPLKITKTGLDLIRDARLNKGLAFSQKERLDFQLNGILAPAVLSLEEQIQNAWAGLKSIEDRPSQYRWLREIRQDNETLFYALLQTYPQELLPIIYTPGIGEACLNYPFSGNRPEGFYLSAGCKIPVKEQLANAPKNIRLIVVTDGSRILGLGDLGANGIGIVIGKSALYTGFAQIDPALILPIMLDIGTENEKYLQDPAYMGWRHKRLQGKKYDDFISECVSAFQEKYPSALLHWEDFNREHAAPLLTRYHKQYLSFNDDIQGTASITLAAILAALIRTGRPLKEEKIMIFGGGSAGCGIATLIAALLRKQGLSEAESTQNIYLVDRFGLITEEMENLTKEQKIFAKSSGTADSAGTDLAQLVKRLKPSTLIGVSGQANMFTEAVLRQMGENSPCPIIFPLSNPTDHAEATPAEIYKATNGRAMICTGSPFPPLEIKSTDMDENRPTTRDVLFSQVNNAAVFPGIGLGALACEAKEISEGMFLAAAIRIAQSSPNKVSKENGILPKVENFSELALEVANAVAEQAQKENLCPKFTPEILEEKLTALQWKAAYREYMPA